MLQTLVCSETHLRHTSSSSWHVSRTSACLPEETHDEGAGEQSDEGEAVTHRGQNPHRLVEEQLHTNTSCLLMEEIRGVFTGTFPALVDTLHTHTHTHVRIYVDTNLVETFTY